MIHNKGKKALGIGIVLTRHYNCIGLKYINSFKRNPFIQPITECLMRGRYCSTIKKKKTPFLKLSPHGRRQIISNKHK